MQFSNMQMNMPTQQMMQQTQSIPQTHQQVNLNSSGDQTVQQGSFEMGVLPVELSRLPFGQSFKFESLLLSEDAAIIKLSVPFKEVKKSWSEKRTLFPYKTVIWTFIIGIILLLFIYLRFLRKK